LAANLSGDGKVQKEQRALIRKQTRLQLRKEDEDGELFMHHAR
jgi:hypothetical protein